MSKRKLDERARNLVSSDASGANFEQSLRRLEEISEQLEAGRLGLGESLVCYEEGVKHLKQCYELLEQAERKIELLAGIDAEGNPIIRPFDDNASLTEESTPSRRRRKSRSESPPTTEAPQPEVEDIDDGGLLF